ncbi:MAG: hypothetical protein OIF58_05250 [Cohaesibacter sp.]|nr:hypothetical protein [Cohaesibacter sp.]
MTGFYNAGKVVFYLFVGVLDFLFHVLFMLVYGLHFALPHVLEQVERQMKKLFTRFEFFQEAFKFPFEISSANRFSIGNTAFCVTQIIRVIRAPTLRPRGCVWLITVTTAHEASKGEVFMQVFTCWCLCPLVHALLHFEKGLIANERFVLGGYHVNAPVLVMDKARIYGAL